MSEEFGYKNKNFDCNKNDIINNDGVAKFIEEKNEWLFDSLKIATFNCLGLSRFSKKTLLKDRLKFIPNEFKKLNLDIICLQEVSKDVIKFLKESNIIRKLYYISNININWDFGGEQVCLILSKIKPLFSKLYYLKGEHYYGLCIIDLGKIVIGNIYLQAGSSEGGIKNINKYSKCRVKQLSKSIRKLKEISKGRQYFLMGDFNFDLDGSNLERKFISKYNLIDIFKKKNPNDPGFTENTDVNTMRYNFKPYIKKLRIDGIFTNKELNIIECKLFGTKPIFSINKSKYKRLTGSDPSILVRNEVEFFLSDHFGIYCEIVIN